MAEAEPSSGPDSPVDPLVEAARLKAEVAALRAEVERLKVLADEDVLTVALNRRAFQREIARAMAFARRYGAPCALIFLDLDGFKAVNDQLGHAAGDCALRRTAEILQSQVRLSDAVGRLGGDEFAILLRQVDQEGALRKAEQLERSLVREGFEWDGERRPITASFGVRALGDHRSVEHWMADADAAMFLRKRASAQTR